MTENDYKEYLMFRIKNYLEEQFIDFKIIDRDIGLIYLYETGSKDVAIEYYPYDAIVKIPCLNLIYESCIKEKCLELFREYFNE